MFTGAFAPEFTPMFPKRQVGPAEESGLPVDEYERRVWDMSRNLIHPAALYVLIQVVGLTRLTSHTVFHRADNAWWEWGLFGASFLGAWAVFYSTLLRDAGFRSLTVTVLVPLSLLVLVAGWIALPGLDEMSAGQAVGHALALAAPGPLAWGVTMLRWRAARREAAPLLAEGESA